MKTHTYPGDAFAAMIQADLDGHPVRVLELPFGDIPVVLAPDVLKALSAVHGQPHGPHGCISEALLSLGVDDAELLRLRWHSTAGEDGKRLHCRATFVTLKGLSQAIGGIPVSLVDPWANQPVTVAA